MRALLFEAFMFLALPVSLVFPHLGVLIYYWISYMAPQQLLWVAAGVPWGKLVVATILIAIPFVKTKQKFPLTFVTVSLIAFFLWCTLTTTDAIYRNICWGLWTDFAKVIAMCLLTIVLMGTRERLQALIWVIVISLGFYTVKGGIFVLLTAGSYHVLGPANSPFTETNGFARAALMLVPLMYFLSLHSARRYVRVGLRVAIALTLLALMGTGSRGGFIGLAAALLVFFAYSRHKARLMISGIVLLVLLIAIIPQQRLEDWTGRMSTIDHFEEVTTAQDRFKAWHYAMDMAAAHPVLGGGFGSFAGNTGIVANPDVALDAHSNYFQVLGDQGYIGLVLYLLLGLAVLLSQRRTYRLTRSRPDLYWARDLAVLLQVDAIGYFVGGLTVNHPYIELYYSLIALTVLSAAMVKRALAEPPMALATALSGPAMATPSEFRP